jgi:hypothetical protein
MTTVPRAIDRRPVCTKEKRTMFSRPAVSRVVALLLPVAMATLLALATPVRADDAHDDRVDAGPAVTSDDDVRSLHCPNRRTCALFGMAAWEKGDTTAAARYFALEASFGVAEDRHAVRERLLAAAQAERFVAARVATHTGFTRGAPAYRAAAELPPSARGTAYAASVLSISAR